MFSDRLSSLAVLDVPVSQPGRGRVRELHPDELRSMPVRGAAFVRGFAVELADPTGGVAAVLADTRLPWVGDVVTADSGVRGECLSLTVRQVGTGTATRWNVVAGYFDQDTFRKDERPLHQLIVERFVEGWNPVTAATLVSTTNAAPLFATSRPPGLASGHCLVSTDATLAHEHGADCWLVRNEITVNHRPWGAKPVDWSPLGLEWATE